MFDEFSKYMWYLLTTPFKRIQKSKNQWYLFFQVVGKWFDECLEDLYTAREETAVATCCDLMLSVHGADRKLTRYMGESWDSFRYRIATYPEVKQYGGTNSGVLMAVQSLGYEGAKITRVPDYKPDDKMASTQWAEFYIIIKIMVNDDEEETENKINIEVLKRIVRENKEVAAKDNYIFAIFLGLLCQEQLCFERLTINSNMYWYNTLRFDGVGIWDGQNRFSGDENHPMHMEYHTEMKLNEDFELQEL